MNKLSKILVIFLCFAVLVFSSSFPFNHHACAIAGVDDLVVGGVAVMTIGLVGVLGMLSMNSAGLSDALYQAASDARQDVREFATTLFTSYARTQNITAGHAVNLAAQGTSYLEDGTIIFNKAMSDLMSGFINWAWDADGGNLIEYGEPVVSDALINGDGLISSQLDYPNAVLSNAYKYNSVSFRPLTTEYPRIDVITGNDVFFIPYKTSAGGYFNIVACSLNTFSLRSFYNSGSAASPNVNSGIYNGQTFYYTPTLKSYSGWFNPSLSNYPLGQYMVGNSYYEAPRDIAIYALFGGITGGDVSYDVNLDVLDNIQNDSDVNLLNPNDFIAVSDAPVGGGTINIDDWLNALAEVSVGQTASLPVESDGVITEAVGELAGTDDIAVTQDAVQAGSQAVADSTSVSSLDEFTLDLTDFFPFCIPFDIYDMLSMFAAERQAPYIEWRFYIPNICDETIVLDFSVFDPVAQVMRTMELVAFAIGLAFATKKLIQGGD